MVRLCAALFVVCSLLPSPANGESICDPDGVQAVGLKRFDPVAHFAALAGL